MKGKKRPSPLGAETRTQQPLEEEKELEKRKKCLR